MSTANSNQSIPPFPPFPCVARFVDHGSAKDTVARVSRAINCGEALSLVIGPPGVGKSLVCNILSQRFAATHDVVMLGEIPITDAASYYRAVLHHLGVDYQSIPAGDLYVSLVDRITGDPVTKDAMTKEGLLIVVDEAQLLSADVLDAIRTTTNIMKNLSPYVSAVVCGGVKLEDTLAASSMESFTQRVATRCYLHPMNASETREYISESIRACGSDPESTMTDEAMGAVHHACNGVPRLINQMMTEAIDCAAEAEQSTIDEKVIDQAWAMLQQLPSPMVDEQKIVHKGTPVEFGALSELGEMPNRQTSQTESSVSTTIETHSIETDSLELDDNNSEAVDSDELRLAQTDGQTDEACEIDDTSNESLLESIAAADPETNTSDEAAEFEGDFDEEFEGSASPMPLGLMDTQDVDLYDDATDNQPHDEVVTAESNAESIVSESETAELETAEADAMESVADEPTIVSVQMTPATSLLFGDFDAEESLPVNESLHVASVSEEVSESVSETTEQTAQVTSEIITSEIITDEELSDIELAAEPELDAEPEIAEAIAEIETASETQTEVNVESEVAVSSQVTPEYSADLEITEDLAGTVEISEEEFAPVAQTSLPSASNDHHETRAMDFEASIHDEVLLLNEMATQARFGGIDPENTFTNPELPSAGQGISAHEQPPIWLAEEDVDCEATPDTIPYDARAYDEHSVVPADADASELCDMQIINDDSDLLIIEDELDVVPRPHVSGENAAEKTVDVDFKAMLSKMRTGT